MQCYNEKWNVIIRGKVCRGTVGILRMRLKDGIRQLDIEKKAELLTGASYWETKECPEIGLSSIKLSDGPHGLRVVEKSTNRMGMGASLPATCFPTASAVACTFNEELCFEMGKAIAEEAIVYGVGMVLGPGLNIKRSPLCGRNFEYFSEDAYLSGKLAAAYVNGMQSKNVTACLKHFAVNSREYARMYCDSRVDEQTLRETYLTGFEIAVKEGKARAVMSAYNKLNGEYCNENKTLLTDILRGEWGFDGLVVSDWGGSHDRLASLNAGADLEMPSCKLSAPVVIEAVKSGELNEKTVDSAVENISTFSRRCDEIFRKPCNFSEHDAFAEKIAQESMVLLKNERKTLPLGKTEKVAVIGDFAKTPRYQGAGSSEVNPYSLDNIVGVIEKSDLNYVGFARGFKRFGGKNEILARQALSLAKKADTVIFCLGTTEIQEVEGLDRTNMEINRNQTDLLRRVAALGKKVVAVLCCGSAVKTDWDEYANALLLAHLSGQSGARAVVKILTGEVNPSGRLAESFPLKYADCPCSSVYNISPYKADYAEGIYVGYKYYNTFDVPVKYPFGYGLSYTTFAIRNGSADRNGVSFTVVNKGVRDGATVVQVYVKSLARSLKDSPFELKLFKKIFLRAGEKQDVQMPFDEYTFRRWNSDSHCWEAGGKYEVTINLDSIRAYHYGSVEITEDNVPGGCVYSAGNGGEVEYENYFLSHITQDEAPKSDNKRVVATYDTPVPDLLHCKGIFGKGIGLLARIYSHSKNKVKAASMDWLCLRSLLQFLELSPSRAEGFLEACNGKLFQGLKKLFKKDGEN